MGGTHSRKLNFRARCIWVWSIRHNFWLTASHIPGPDIHIADSFSRSFKDDIEWCLNKEVFLQKCNHFGEPDLDLSASRLNRQTLNFVSWFPDLEALMTDTFSFGWGPFLSYGFPPCCLLNKCLAKIRSDSAMGIFILPVWPTQPWFPEMLHLLAANPVMLPQSENFCSAIFITTNEIDSMSIIWMSLTHRGIPQQTARTIITSWRDSSKKQYLTSIRQWDRFCVIRKIHPYRASVLDGLNFLQYLFNLSVSYSSINTARSALSFIVPRNGYGSFGQHFLVKKFIRGVSNLRTPAPK